MYWLRNTVIRARNNLVVWILKLSENSCYSGFVLYNAMSWKIVIHFGENPSFHHLHKKRAFNYFCSFLSLSLICISQLWYVWWAFVEIFTFQTLLSKMQDYFWPGSELFILKWKRSGRRARISEGFSGDRASTSFLFFKKKYLKSTRHCVSKSFFCLLSWGKYPRSML